MKVYLAGEREATQTADGVVDVWAVARRRLFSFFYHGLGTGPTESQHRAAEELKLDLFLDSGAFTAFTKQVVIDPKEYAQFVQETRAWWTVCSSLDVIGEGEQAAQASYDMWRRLRDLGAGVIPVFHVREPDHWLAKYVEDERVPYLAIGGMVPETTRWLKDRLDGLWAQVLTHPDGTAKTQVHGFGLTTFDLMWRYPWHSVDSSTWVMTGIYGAVMLPTKAGIRRVFFSDDSPQARNADGWHYHALTLVPDDPRKAEVDRLLATYGVTAAQCAASYVYRDVVNARVYQDFEHRGAVTFHVAQPTLF